MLACPYTLDWMWTLRTCCLRVPREGGSLLLSDICLQKRCHRSSEFGDGIDVNAFAQMKLARVANIVLITSASIESVCREPITSLFTFMYTCSQVALPMRTLSSVFSANKSQQIAGKAFALSAPMAHHIGSILTQLQRP